MRKIWKKTANNKEVFKAMSEIGVDPLLSAMISTRNYDIRNKEDLKNYISCNPDDLENYTKVPGMIESVKLIDDKYKKVVIFGDYDVDGLISTFMLKKVLSQIGIKDVTIHTPDRKLDGYGLNPRSFLNFQKKFKNEKIDLLFMLDCGTNSKKEIQSIKDEFDNIKTIVVDHHIVSEGDFASNADAITNPRLSEGTTPYCTGGLVYQLIRGLSERYPININEYTAYAAITTIADVAELDSNNRNIVANGLKSMDKCVEKGFRTLMEVAGVDPNNCSVRDISFGIAPRINANGRIKKAEIVDQLLSTDNLQTAKSLVKEINDTNEERKKIQRKIIEESINSLEGFDGNAILDYDEKWHPGIVGIVASRLVEEFNVPTIVFGGDNGNIKGSARSIGTINVKEAMDKIAHIFEVYGGHEMAAGATLKKEFKEEAPELFDKAIVEYKKENNIDGIPVYYHLSLKEETFKKFDESLCDKIEKLGPFGQGNEPLIFKVDNIKCTRVHQWSKNNGAFVKFGNAKLDCFYYGKDSKDSLEGKTMSILVEICENFKDGEKWAFAIKEVEMS